MRSVLLLALATPAFAAEPPDVLPAMRETCPVAREYFGEGPEVKPAAPRATEAPRKAGGVNPLMFLLALTFEISRT